MTFSASDRELAGMLPRVRWLAYLFAIIAAIMTYRAGYAFGGDDKAASVIIGVGLAAVTGLVFYLLAFGVSFWERGAKGTAAIVLAFWCLGFVVEYWSHVAFTVTHRTGEIQQAAFRTTVSDDTGQSIAAAQRWLEQLERERALMKPQRSQADAIAVVKSTEAHRWYLATDSCTAARGPQRQAFCDTYRAAQADIQTWDAVAAANHRIEQARADVARLQGERRGMAPAVSVSEGQARLLATAFSGSLEPTQASIAWANISIGSMISLIFSLASAVCLLVATRFEAMTGLVGLKPVPPRPMAYHDVPEPVQQTVTKTVERRDPRIDALHSGLQRLEASLKAA